MLGDEYISQHIYNERYKEFVDISYKVYVTDCLQTIAGTQRRWYSTIEKLEKEPSKEPDINELLEMVQSIK